jgi:hypothetical protein
MVFVTGKRSGAKGRSSLKVANNVTISLPINGYIINQIKESAAGRTGPLYPAESIVFSYKYIRKDAGIIFVG